MTPITRRGFVALGAGVAAGAAMPPVTAGAAVRTSTASATATTGTIKDVRHVVVLMQENRSFDHYFGGLKGVRGFSDRSGITIGGGRSVFDQPNGTGRQYPWKLSATPAAGGADPETIAQCNGDLPHSWTSQHSAWNKGRMDNWVTGVGNVRSLGHLERSDIPFHYALADNYTVCDAYFSSALSATGPNRTFLWSGKVDASSKDGGDESGLTWEAYAEALQRAGVSWRVYQNADDNYGDNGLAYFRKFTDAPAGDPLHDLGMASVKKVTGSTPDDIAAAIKADVVAGTLPQVSWVVANQAFSEHPYAPPGDGAHFVDLVYRALAADQDVFDSTVLFLNYDENDGFFDHVPPPSPPAGTEGEFLGGVPIGLGFRVPMIVMSPWTRGGWVSSEVFDHTSVLRFLETWTTALGKPAACPNISTWRRKVSGDLTGVFDFAHPVKGVPSGLPATPVIGMNTCGPLPNPVPQNNALPAQEPGTRPARALPYQPGGDLDRLEFGAAGAVKLWLTMTNKGAPATRAAHFSVHPNAYRSTVPWQYTVDAGGTATDFFNIGTGNGDGKYDFTMAGPNRFLRRFTGDATAAGKSCEVAARYADAPDTGRPALWFTFTNTSAGAVTFTVTSGQYRSDGPWTYTVPAGGSREDYFNAVTLTKGWYDFTVRISGDASWSRRYTGHIETGAASVSG
ncbi:phospholipase C, phosphocholine-specific [Streptomyces sp. NBC_01369]|uniref:phosphocholine-specific phospholipase C n=1 Tax=unclassified Streptomyces TaxID=2593676 RepID=UPI00225A8263|nr:MULTISPECIES: phospholipase C, phosphocholine-specific [unclassified Streptomyces]MCX4862753.1 phospholipase C, phosphocholine-specific [Streptomyces sp. NBC_00906]MCX4893990.1 phospholipase C, phosphocholine-specific [Streptomyces sp. NBC_00892]